MFGRISLWAAGAVVAGLMLPSQAMAQYDAQVATDLNLRVGPGTEYGIIDVIPAGYPVDVLRGLSREKKEFFAGLGQFFVDAEAERVRRALAGRIPSGARVVRLTRGR